MFGKAARGQRRLAKVHIDWLVHEGRIVRDDKFLEGRDGWLFLADDSNDVLAQHAGTRRFEPHDLDCWRALLRRRVSRLAERGCHYTTLVAPNTHSVYPENLPATIRHAPERPVHQLIDALARDSSPARLIYPLEEMTAHKAVGPVCSPIDSHWSDFGAFVAYSVLADELSGYVEMRRMTRADVVFYDLIGGGDLGSKLDPMRLEVQPVAIVRYPQARLLYDNCVENKGSIAITECRVAPPTTCLLLADSYSYSIVKFLSESFGRLVIAHSPNLDWNLVEQFDPDAVVGMMAERFLIEVPDDNDVSLAEHEVAKRAARRTRPPLIHWHHPARWPSPAEAERLREHLLAIGRVRDATIISVLAYGGLLPHEVTALRWPDVGERELMVRRRGKRVGEASPARIVPMIGPLAEDLQEWKSIQRPNRPRELVFPGDGDAHWASGEWTSWRRTVFEPAVRACALDLETPHELRHTFCTLALQQGVHPRDLARQVGAGHDEIKHLYGALAKLLRTWEPADPAAVVRAARESRPVAALQSG